MLRYLTAGESHGKGLTAIIEGLPSNLKIDTALIQTYMAARKSGYGRGARQKMEPDTVEFLSGVRGGKTLGSPVTLFIKNNDFDNWAYIMGSKEADLEKRVVTAPRPGHADLVGSLKYGFSDCRNVLERASARETAIRVAVGAVAMCLTRELGITSASYVQCVGGIEDQGEYSVSEIQERVFSSPVRAMAHEEEMIARIKGCAEAGDTVGGKVTVKISGVREGLGSFVHFDRKLDAHLAFANMSVQAVKGCEIGAGGRFARENGSFLMDQIEYDGANFTRKTNNSGGIDGGMTTGEDIVLTCTMKPIPTLKTPLPTVDIRTKQTVAAAFERSDVCAVPALSVICECVSIFEVAKFILAEYGCSDMEELKKLWKR